MAETNKTYEETKLTQKEQDELTQIEINEQKELTEEEQDYDISFICRFCNVKLIGGYDDKELVHCQYCHNIWDGNAQCNCWMNE